MARQYRSNYPPVPRHGSSPSPSAIRSSPLSSLGSFPVTSSPFPSSPFSSSQSFTSISSTVLTSSPPASRGLTAQLSSPPSPDLIDDHTIEMEESVRVVENADEGRRQKNLPPLFLRDGVPMSGDFPMSPTQRDGDTWVVFHGKAPGVYAYFETAAIQTVGEKDGFQRCYPNRASAEDAFHLFQMEGIYPDYGTAPWVVFLGRRIGVATKITELESSVKGFSDAVFQSCASVSIGKIRFELFSQEVARMFADRDPFDAMLGFMPRQGENSPTDSPVGTQEPTPQPVAGPSRSQSSRPAIRAADPKASTSTPSPRYVTKTACRNSNQGWFVAWHAVLPGVYYGVEALQTAQPQRGGYKCAVDEDSANNTFHEYMTSDRLIFTRK